MKYLADILTLTRFVLALAIFYGCVMHHGSTEAALIMFLVAELTDAFDGTCARKWPFPKNKIPKYRKFASKYDMIADVLLAAAMVLFLTFRIDFTVGVAFITYYIGVCGLIELVVYGKFFGHPDDFAKNSLMDKNFNLARKIILVRRYGHALCLGIISVIVLFSTRWSDATKYILLIVGCLFLVFAWFFLKQRRENISRDAVDVEKKLAKKKSQ